MVYGRPFTASVNLPQLSYGCIARQGNLLALASSSAPPAPRPRRPPPVQRRARADDHAMILECEYHAGG